MLKQVVVVLNRIVNQQIRIRTCITLPAEMQQFLEWLTKTQPSRETNAGYGTDMDYENPYFGPITSNETTTMTCGSTASVKVTEKSTKCTKSTATPLENGGNLAESTTKRNSLIAPTHNQLAEKKLGSTPPSCDNEGMDTLLSTHEFDNLLG